MSNLCPPPTQPPKTPGPDSFTGKVLSNLDEQYILPYPDFFRG